MGNRHCGSRGGGSVGEYIEGSQSGSGWKVMWE